MLNGYFEIDGMNSLIAYFDSEIRRFAHIRHTRESKTTPGQALADSLHMPELIKWYDNPATVFLGNPKILNGKIGLVDFCRFTVGRIV